MYAIKSDDGLYIEFEETFEQASELLEALEIMAMPDSQGKVTEYFVTRATKEEILKANVN